MIIHSFIHSFIHCKNHTTNHTLTIADGELIGRTVTFSNSSTGMVVAHRHPIAFVLLDSSSEQVAAGSNNGGNDEVCSISTKPVTLDPTSVPAGSTVDYLGRHVAVLNDGSVSRSLPKASSPADSITGVGVGAPDGGISLLVDGIVGVGSNANGANERPLFVSIPKISDIGLMDSPLVTGITAIDALTPIGKGQNMLVIGEEEDIDASKAKGAVNKRGWMINLLKNVVQNHRNQHNNGGDGSNGMMCFFTA